MMSTKNTGVGLDRGIFDSPYDAFTNYMNIIADFISRVNAFYPEGVDKNGCDFIIAHMLVEIILMN